jgi:hypothetical protein
MSSKVCFKCKEEKLLDKFYVAKTSKDGFQSNCKVCQLHYTKTYQKENPHQVRKWKLKAKYQLNPEHYEQMLKAQNGRCAICKTTDPGGRHNRWNIDHCHTTNKVRGLLCHCCNFGLGYFKDNQIILKQSIAYLNCDHTTPSHKPDANGHRPSPRCFPGYCKS